LEEAELKGQKIKRGLRKGVVRAVDKFTWRAIVCHRVNMFMERNVNFAASPKIIPRDTLDLVLKPLKN